MKAHAKTALIYYLGGLKMALERVVNRSADIYGSDGLEEVYKAPLYVIKRWIDQDLRYVSNYEWSIRNDYMPPIITPQHYSLVTKPAHEKLFKHLFGKEQAEAFRNLNEAFVEDGYENYFRW